MYIIDKKTFIEQEVPDSKISAYSFNDYAVLTQQVFDYTDPENPVYLLPSKKYRTGLLFNGFVKGLGVNFLNCTEILEMSEAKKAELLQNEEKERFEQKFYEKGFAIRIILEKALCMPNKAYFELSHKLMIEETPREKWNETHIAVYLKFLKLADGFSLDADGNISHVDPNLEIHQLHNSFEVVGGVIQEIINEAE